MKKSHVCGFIWLGNSKKNGGEEKGSKRRDVILWKKKAFVRRTDSINTGI